MSLMAFLIILAVMFILGYLIGRERRIKKYFDEISAYRDQKNHYFEMCKRLQKLAGEGGKTPPPVSRDAEASFSLNAKSKREDN